ncbi:ABC transporter permease [Deferrisoma camini]|uniref:ABC transporter permease n=1 Tax=Deferrisoma camini TaxID=1035120 RepID=UPI00046D3F2D|nr:ABC transporter permease [Deferrisoma camini]
MGRLGVSPSGQRDAAPLAIEGRLSADRAAELRTALRRHARTGSEDLVLDLSTVTHLGTAALAVLVELDRELRPRGRRLRITGAQGSVAAMLSAVDWEDLACRRLPGRPPQPGLVLQVGTNALYLLTEMRRLFSFAGGLFLCSFSCLLRSRLRLAEMLRFVDRAGVDAVPIVALSAALLGLILGFLGSLQLKPYGAQLLVADMVALAIVRELGPVITSILVAGRSGSGYAAELGAMVVDEEVDALTTMGFDPVEFLAVPRVAAVAVSMPVLILISDLAGVLGGLAVGVFAMDLTAAQYLEETRAVLTLQHLIVGVAKGCVFGTVAAAVGCFKGLGVRGGANAVGRAATSAVVTGIFLVILLDSLFAVILAYLPF